MACIPKKTDAAYRSPARIVQNLGSPYFTPSKTSFAFFIRNVETSGILSFSFTCSSIEAYYLYKLFLFGTQSNFIATGTQRKAM
jgi:hypothetical protein